MVTLKNMIELLNVNLPPWITAAISLNTLVILKKYIIKITGTVVFSTTVMMNILNEAVSIIQVMLYQ